MFTIATFYRFIELTNYEDMQAIIKDFCIKKQIKGTILLAEEGINATIAGTQCAIEDFFLFMNTEERFSNMCWQKSSADYQPFARMKVRLKREIVNLGIKEGLDPNSKGEYIAPDTWDDFIARDDVMLIDTRNIYEIKLGKFKNSLNPCTNNFRDFSAWAEELKDNKQKKIAMYCTGGIRCEKSTAYMKRLGFDQVYHLRGGILNYLSTTKNKKQNWEGDCFVFDDRVAVDENLQLSEKIRCVMCNNKASTDDLKSVTRGQVVCSDCAFE